MRDDDSRHKEYVEHVYVNISNRNEMDNFLRFCDERIEKVMNVKPKFELQSPEFTAQSINQYYSENVEKKPYFKNNRPNS